MELHYLDFEFSDEESGHGSFDAMASVIPQRLPPLLEEVAAVLRWAHVAFGPPASIDEGGEWDYALQALAEPEQALPVAYEPGSATVALAPAGDERVTLTLTVGGSAAFCEALRDAFGIAR